MIIQDSNLILTKSNMCTVNTDIKLLLRKKVRQWNRGTKWIAFKKNSLWKIFSIFWKTFKIVYTVFEARMQGVNSETIHSIFSFVDSSPLLDWKLSEIRIFQQHIPLYLVYLSAK